MKRELLLTAALLWSGGVARAEPAVSQPEAVVSHGGDYKIGEVDPYTITPVWFPHGVAAVSPPPPPPPSCPLAIDGGCAASPGGNFTQANFYTHAAQNGQTYTATASVNWNKCGIDYACGYYTATASLKDPTSITPTGCTYQPTGSTGGGPFMHCTSATVDIEGFDFSLHGCIPIDIGTGVTSLTVKNNKFASGANCLSENYFGNGSMFIWGQNAVPADFDFESNNMDGGGAPGVAGLTNCVLIYMGSGKTATIKYNVVTNCDNQPFQILGAGGSGGFNVVSSSNYVENMVYTSGLHGEFIIGTSTGGNITYSSQYDTVLQGSTVKVNGSTACFYLTPGQDGPTMTSATMDHDLCIVNLNGGSVTTSYAGEFGSGPTGITYGTLGITNNGLDITGAFGAWLMGHGSCTSSTLSGNFLLTSGASKNAWDSNLSSNC